MNLYTYAVVYPGNGVMPDQVETVMISTQNNEEWEDFGSFMGDCLRDYFEGAVVTEKKL